MRVDSLVELLQKYYEPQQEIVVYWYDRNSFDPNMRLTANQWGDMCDHLNDLDLSDLKDTLDWHYEDYLPQLTAGTYDDID